MFFAFIDRNPDKPCLNMFITVKSIFVGNVLNEDVLDDIASIRTAFCIVERDAEYSIPELLINMHESFVCICQGYHISITLLCLSLTTSHKAGKGYINFLIIPIFLSMRKYDFKPAILLFRHI